MGYRYDFDVITEWIEPGEKVLDLGCGDGSLLKHLIEVRDVQGWGVEIDPDNVVACLANGINVIQVDLEKGLAGFEDGFFDHVIMSLSLQAIHNTQGILAEMLRVAREARGESVHEVAFAIKLSPRQVEALEKDDFAALPGMAFVRGFARNYARYANEGNQYDEVLAFLDKHGKGR